ncbi:DUF3088 domain-containing protein [Sphingomonas sp. Leaf22]|uniref:DUF3088 domain-containing protein n=1 Tax=Sphingomonas sp. Leaf22 TaxID=1735687 RepID=UPI000ABFE457|nr:DUF3088 domain-containing protein [Sphingomonas sp. Leaf22]
MTTISNLPPIRPTRLTEPAFVPTKAPAGPAPGFIPGPNTGIDSVAYDAILAMVTRAIASLPPGTALSNFLHTVARVTAEVEAQLAAAPVPMRDGGTLSAEARATTAHAEVIAQRLAAAFAPDPVAARAAIADAFQPQPVSAPDVSARDLAFAAAAMFGTRADPVLQPTDPSPTNVDPDADPLFSEHPMRDRLYLLDPQFDDPAYPGRSFYCRDCITVDGLLARFPDKASLIEVVRIPYPRPRDAVVAVVGEAHQNLPLLVLGAGADAGLSDGRYGDIRFVSDFKRLLHALHIRHGFPEAHP